VANDQGRPERAGQPAPLPRPVRRPAEQARQPPRAPIRHHHRPLPGYRYPKPAGPSDSYESSYDYAGQDPINSYDLDGLKKKKPRTPHPGPQAIASIAHVGNEVEANGYGTIAPDVKNPTGVMTITVAHNGNVVAQEEYTVPLHGRSEIIQVPAESGNWTVTVTVTQPGHPPPAPGFDALTIEDPRKNWKPWLKPTPLLRPSGWGIGLWKP
jgi:hypothetical protein